MARAVILPGFSDDQSLPQQSLAPAPEAMGSVYLDFSADTLRLGDPGPIWGAMNTSSRAMTFSRNRPIVMEEGGRQFVRFSNDDAGSSAGFRGASNSGAITKFVRFRFPDGNPSGMIIGVYGSGTPTIYIPGASVYPAAHRGEPNISTVPVDDGQWHNLVAVFTATGSVINVDGVERTIEYTPAIPENGFTLNYWNGSIYTGRRLDVARAGQFQGLATAETRQTILAKLTENT